MPYHPLFAAAALASAAITSASSAEVTVQVLEVGNDIVLTGSGSLDLSLATFFNTVETGGPSIVSFAAFIVGPSSENMASNYSLTGFKGPAELSSRFLLMNPTSGTGDLFGLSFFLGHLIVPVGYVSGDPLAGTTTFENQNFDSLGIQPGTYTWQWDTITGTDSMTLMIIQQCEGDLDGDQMVTQADLGILLASFNRDGGGDLDGDGMTTQADLGILLANFGCGTR